MAAVEQSLKEKINQRRAQMLIHSYLYYWVDTSCITDHKWQEWADELVELQEQNKGQPTGFYDNAFEVWSGATGCHLPKDEWVATKARRLLWVLDNYPKVC